MVILKEKQEEEKRFRNKEIKETEDKIVDLLAQNNFTLAESLLILEDIKFRAFIGREVLKQRKAANGLQHPQLPSPGPEMYR